MNREELKNIVGKVRQCVELEKEMGVEEYPRRRRAGSKEEGLKELEEQVRQCARCSLSRGRLNAVPGEGSADAKLVFVGEAPGAEEDKQGRPFVGRAGALLTKIIASIGLKREEVYIANCLKCRPPANRNPLPEELVQCESYLVEQLEIIKPRVICALGKFAAQQLLKTETPISRLRGKTYEYHGVTLIPTFHPAYLLRNASGKRPVWEDMKKIRRILEGKGEKYRSVN